MSGADAREAFSLLPIPVALVDVHRCLTCWVPVEARQRASHRDWHISRGDVVATRRPPRLAPAPVPEGDMPAPPPVDIPPHDYAVIRSDGALRRHGRALWRWSTGIPTGAEPGWSYLGPDSDAGDPPG